MDAFDSICPRCQGKGIKPLPNPTVTPSALPTVAPPTNEPGLPKWVSSAIVLVAVALLGGSALILHRPTPPTKASSAPPATFPTPAASAPTPIPVENVSPVVVADTPLPVEPPTIISAPTPKPVVFTKLSQSEIIEQLVNKWGNAILEAKSAEELDVIRVFLSSAKAGMDEARPKNVSPDRWSDIARNQVMQSALFQLGRAADERMRIFTGADTMGRSDSTARQMINMTNTFVHQNLAPPEEQRQQQQDMVEAVRKNATKATWRE